MQVYATIFTCQIPPRILAIGAYTSAYNSTNTSVGTTLICIYIGSWNPFLKGLHVYMKMAVNNPYK